MRRVTAWVILPLLGLVGATVAAFVECPACIDSGRRTSRCEWNGDTPFALLPGNPAHHQHLVADAQLAEEIAIRYADREHERRFGYEGHGGLIENGGLRKACMARLVASIESLHAVSGEQVQSARAERNLRFDLIVALLFVPVYWLGAALVVRSLDRRFSADERYVRALAVVLTSVAVSVLAVQVLQLWLMVWEAIRVGNGHISAFRTATYTSWTHRYTGDLYALGAVGFWLVAVSGRRISWVMSAGAATLACAVLVAEFVQRFARLG